MTDRRALPADIAEVWREQREHWLFALRTASGCLLALWLAFRLNLHSPSSAAITVTIVALPQSGYVIEKAFYRLTGTLFGGAVGLLLVAAFAQQREFFLIGLAAWIGVCAAWSQKLRNFRAYAFVLSGYTACIVGYPAFIAPDSALQIAVDRVSAVALGLLCGTVLNATILPRSAAVELVGSIRRRLPEFLNYARAVLSEVRPRQQVQQQQDHILHSIVALEAVRGAAYFEDAESRIRSSRLRRLNGEFTATSTALHAIYRLREDLLARERTRVVAALHPLTDQLLAQLETGAGQVPRTAAEAAPVARDFGAWLSQWNRHAALARQRLGPPGGSADELREFEAGLQLLHWFAQDLSRYLDTYAQLRNPRRLRADEAPAPTPRTDPLVAAVAGLRCMLAIVLTGLFWMQTGWADGFNAFILVCVFPALFATMPNPMSGIRGVAIGFAIGAVFTVPMYLFVVPRLDGYAELAAAQLPPLLLFCSWIARPATSTRGLGAMLMLLTGISLTNPMQYDVAVFANRIVATFAGFAFSAFAYTALPLPGPAWVTARLQRALPRQLRTTVSDTPERARHAFESGVADLITQITPRLGADVEARRRQLDAGLTVLEAGFALLRLRQQNAGDSPLFRLVPAAFENPRHIDPVLQAIEDQLQGRAGRNDARTVAALRLLHLSLREWRAHTANEVAPLPEPAHAA
ncbi:FUSC family protein [Algiphilus sp. W345]|uniref:FUSC family protein n=1 Tax=Banduia mediterranea TaxID=3075609 RepID=A0ABU2WFT2_9GAMM|nr:FUSC family protein [Algiphilus sp. W345]MDT0496725.1 FUSC family protein [Algiphilus sp. W345]